MFDNILYQEYMDEDEREMILACERANLTMEKLFNTYYMYEQKAELDLREAELKCMEESGDMDDLIALYTEAKEETKEKSDGILKRIWNAIVAAFQKVKEFLFGSGKKIDPNSEYEVPKGILGHIKSGCRWLIGIIKAGAMGVFTAFAKHKNAAAFATAMLGICCFVKKDAIKERFIKDKKEKVPGSELKDVEEELDDVTDAATEACKKMASDADNEKDAEKKSLIVEFADFLKTIPGNIQYLVGLLTGKKAADDSSGEEESEDNSGDNPKKISFKLVKSDGILKVYRDYLENEKHEKDPGPAVKKFEKMMPKQRAALLRQLGFVVESPDGDIDSDLFAMFGESGVEYNDDDLEGFFGESANTFLSEDEVDWADI